MATQICAKKLEFDEISDYAKQAWNLVDVVLAGIYSPVFIVATVMLIYMTFRLKTVFTFRHRVIFFCGVSALLQCASNIAKAVVFDCDTWGLKLGYVLELFSYTMYFNATLVVVMYWAENVHKRYSTGIDVKVLERRLCISQIVVYAIFNLSSLILAIVPSAVIVSRNQRFSMQISFYIYIAVIAALITLSFTTYGIVLLKLFLSRLTDKFATGGKKDVLLQLSLITATCTLSFTLLAVINIVITIVISVGNISSFARYLLWTIPFVALISATCLHIFPMFVLLFFFGVDMKQNSEPKEDDQTKEIEQSTPKLKPKKRNAFMNFDDTGVELKDSPSTPTSSENVNVQI